MPGTWAQYGVDMTGNGIKDPYDPIDAIFAAARYLHAAGQPNTVALPDHADRIEVGYRPTTAGALDAREWSSLTAQLSRLTAPIH